MGKEGQRSTMARPWVSPVRGEAELASMLNFEVCRAFCPHVEELTFSHARCIRPRELCFHMERCDA